MDCLRTLWIRWICRILYLNQLTRRLSLPVLSIKGYSIPVAGLLSGAIAGEVGFWLFAFYGWNRKSTIQRDAVFAARSIPLWSNARHAVNPSRAFF